MKPCLYHQKTSILFSFVSVGTIWGYEFLITRHDKIRWKGLVKRSDIENPAMDISLCCDMPEIINDSRVHDCWQESCPDKILEHKAT